MTAPGYNCLVPDGASGVIISWMYLGTADNLQDSLEMVSDGSGGALTTWRDDRNNDSDIYAQRAYSELCEIDPTALDFGLVDLGSTKDLTFTITSRTSLTGSVSDDLTGRLVRELEHGDFLEAGVHRVVWDGRDGKGAAVASGVSLYRLEAGPFVETRRMTLLK